MTELWLAAAIWAAPAIAGPPPEQAACEQGDPASCLAAGKRYLNGEGVPVDAFYAVKMFRKGCAGDEAHACMFLAEAYRRGSGVSPDPTEALELYEKACELGDGLACRSVGDLYILGNATGTSGRVAGGWYTMGCELGDPQACTAAALWYERGDLGAADQEKARALLVRGCEGGHARGCTLLGIRSQKGSDGMPRDLEAAASWFRKGCVGEPDPESCRELGWMAWKGKGIAEDPAAAQEHLDVACFANDTLGCRYLAIVLQKDDAITEAFVAAQRACDLGDRPSCARAVRLQAKLMDP